MTRQQLEAILINLPWRAKDQSSWRFSLTEAGWAPHPRPITSENLRGFLLYLTITRAALEDHPLFVSLWRGHGIDYWSSRQGGNPPPWASPIDDLFKQLNEGTI